MAEAQRLAAATGRLGNVPVGAVVLCGGEIVAKAANLRDTLADPTAHAELLALADAGRARGDWRLEDATLVVTLEPCPMCAGALLEARVGRVIYGATEPRTGAVESRLRLLDGAPVEVVAGVEAHACQALLADFFEDLRRHRG